MKLYVWENALHDSSLAAMAAVAESVEQARELLQKADFAIPSYELAAQPKVIDMTQSYTLVVWVGS